MILIQDYHFALLPGQIRPRAAQGDHRAVLAHSLAQCRDLRRVPVEARDAVAHADGRHPRLPHALSLPELSLHRRSLRRMPDRPRAHDGGPAGPRVPRHRRSDLDRVAAALARTAAGDRGLRGARCASATASASMCLSAWASSAGISPRGSSSASMRSRLLLDQQPRLRGQHHAAADRGPLAQQAAGLPGAAASDARRGRAHQCADSRPPDWRPIVLVGKHQSPSRCSSSIAPPISASSTACTTA